jgi:hypothetical protein
MKKLVILSTILLLSFFSNSALSQQCPPDYYGYVPGPWTFGGCYDLPLNLGGQVCVYHICYCYKNSPLMPETDIYITQLICLTPGCSHDQFFTLAQIYKKAGEEIILQNPGNHAWPCPPCSLDVEQVYRIILAPCFTQDWQPCFNNWEASCVYEYDVCCEMGLRTATLVNSFVEGECSGYCTPNCP